MRRSPLPSRHEQAHNPSRSFLAACPGSTERRLLPICAPRPQIQSSDGLSMTRPSCRMDGRGHWTLPLAMVAESLDELLFGHRGAALDAGPSGLLAQLLDGVLFEVLRVPGLRRFGLGRCRPALSGPPGCGLRLGRLGLDLVLPCSGGGADRVGLVATTPGAPLDLAGGLGGKATGDDDALADGCDAAVTKRAPPGAVLAAGAGLLGARHCGAADGLHELGGGAAQAAAGACRAVDEPARRTPVAVRLFVTRGWHGYHFPHLYVFGR